MASNYGNVRAFLGQQNREGTPQACRAACNITMLRRVLMIVGDRPSVGRTFPRGSHFFKFENIEYPNTRLIDKTKTSR